MNQLLSLVDTCYVLAQSYLEGGKCVIMKITEGDDEHETSYDFINESTGKSGDEYKIRANGKYSRRGSVLYDDKNNIIEPLTTPFVSYIKTFWIYQTTRDNGNVTIRITPEEREYAIYSRMAQYGYVTPDPVGGWKTDERKIQTFD